MPPWNDYYSRSWLNRACTPVIIYHDQEPLQFDLYSREVLKTYILNKFPDQIPESSLVLEHYIDMHLRAAINEPHHGYNKILLCHSEKNSAELEKYQQHGFVGVYYWSHALIARDWYRHAEHDLKLRDKTVVKDFLIYNRAWLGTREYRLKFAELLCENKLQNNCVTSFMPIDQDLHYQHHQFKNPAFAITNLQLETNFPANNSTANASADYDPQDYTTTGIEIVLETLFDDQRNHLTEKTLRPIACGHPFMLAASAGSLQYLRSYGFRTFQGLIDETYDTIVDPLCRLNAIVSEMKRITNLPTQAKSCLFDQLQEIASYNQTLFFSKEWHQSITHEYSTNIKSALAEVQHSKSGKLYQEYGSIVHTAPKRAEIFHQPLNGKRTQQDLDAFVQWLDNTTL